MFNSVLYSGRARPFHRNRCVNTVCDSGEGRKRSQMSMPATSEYTLGGKNVDLTNMVGIIKVPGGATEPCLLKKMPDGKLGTCTCPPHSSPIN